jgi:hypothetical protein
LLSHPTSSASTGSCSRRLSRTGLLQFSLLTFTMLLWA